MKIFFKLQGILVFLLCFIWQNSYSQLLYPELYPDPKKDEYLPPYDPNVVVISPSVEKWIGEQLAKGSEKKTVKMKTDVLGRAKSSADEIGQEKVVENKQKRLVVIADMHIRKYEIEPEQGSCEYNYETKNYDCFLNDKKINEKEHLEYLNKKLAKLKQQKRGKRDLPIPGVIHGADDRIWVASMTAEEISELTKNYKELMIDDYREPKPTAINTSINDLLQTIQLAEYGSTGTPMGKGIGIYVNEVYCRDPNFPIVTKDNYTSFCTSPYDTHHGRVVNVLQKAAPAAHIYGFSYYSNFKNGTILHPSNPSSYSPPMEIGTHSYCWPPGTNPNEYNIYDASMDNYIYEHKMANFVGAGNVGPTGNCDATSFYVTSPAKALNAISVGAVNYAENLYKDYSAWKNSEVGNNKPELAMYTDIDIGGNYGSIGGTSAATPLAAGFAAALLGRRPFLKTQPALLKAALLAGEAMPINYASSWDQDNLNLGYNAFSVARGIMNYSSVVQAKFMWKNGGNSEFFDSNDEMKFTEVGIQANKRYRIAIAWLTNGSYVSQNKKMAQNLNLYVRQNGQFIAYSTSFNNPFEIVDFITKSNAPLEIVIHRYSNSKTDNIHFGYYMRREI